MLYNPHGYWLAEYFLCYSITANNSLRSASVMKIVSRISFIVCFVSLYIFSPLTIADDSVYLCKENGRKVYKNMPCEDNALIKTIPILITDRQISQEEKTILPLNNIYPNSNLTINDETGRDEAKQAIDDASQEAEEIARVATEEAEERARIATEEAEERARITTEEAEERARVAAEETQQTALNLHNELIRSTVRSKNNIYLGSLILLVAGFITYFIKKENKGKTMNQNQKYGVVTMIMSFFLILLVLMISDGWVQQLDYLENLMNNLKIEKFLVETKDVSATFGYDLYYLIDVPTKYVVLCLLAIAAYGFTTYIGITTAVRPWKKN
jgi:vacuolar-type H+-ATPase subunit H